MTITISISPEVELKLRERAVSFGKDIAQYAADLVERGVAAPTFEEILEPVRRDFRKTGMTPDELDEFGRNLISKVRSDRHATRKNSHLTSCREVAQVRLK